eukprot:TRINITY_DN3799_c0_g1_i5.p1 TRINITY_DN3799_c0_g1~~TRINITY_DN3799_c0_g1_i5.p1  ORF type:complete len:742 (+),score=162.15 TRINITY_DN3799_c0_g1_i5:44-2269(+)
MSEASESGSDEIIGSRLHDYTIEAQLGYGEFSKVYRAVSVVDESRVAVKVISKGVLQDKSKDEKIEKEINALRTLQHPHILKLLDVIEVPDKKCLILEYAPFGDMLELYLKHGCAPSDMSRFWFKQIISGVSYCHENGIIHRDLKLDNFLLDENLHVKIADFGFIANVDPNQIQNTWLRQSCGSPAYAAPEILTVPDSDDDSDDDEAATPQNDRGTPENGYLGPPVDVWSLGVCLYAMNCGWLPFEDEDPELLYESVLKGRYDMPMHISVTAQTLISRMLTVNPKRRISMQQVKSHPYLQTEILDATFLEQKAVYLARLVDEISEGEVRSSSNADSVDSEPLTDDEELSHQTSKNQGTGAPLSVIQDAEAEDFSRGAQLPHQQKHQLHPAHPPQRRDSHQSESNSSDESIVEVICQGDSVDNYLSNVAQGKKDGQKQPATRLESGQSQGFGSFTAFSHINDDDESEVHSMIQTVEDGEGTIQETIRTLLNETLMDPRVYLYTGKIPTTAVVLGKVLQVWIPQRSWAPDQVDILEQDVEDENVLSQLPQLIVNSVDILMRVRNLGTSEYIYLFTFVVCLLNWPNKQKVENQGSDPVVTILENDEGSQFLVDQNFQTELSRLCNQLYSRLVRPTISAIVNLFVKAVENCVGTPFQDCDNYNLFTEALAPLDTLQSLLSEHPTFEILKSSFWKEFFHSLDINLFNTLLKHNDYSIDLGSQLKYFSGLCQSWCKPFALDHQRMTG